MQIKSKHTSPINFKQVRLARAEENLVNKYLVTISKPSLKIKHEEAKLKLFEILNKHFQAEIAKYSKLYMHKEDFYKIST
jgi:hypothetical protein